MSEEVEWGDAPAGAAVTPVEFFDYDPIKPSKGGPTLLRAGNVALDQPLRLFCWTFLLHLVFALTMVWAFAGALTGMVPGYAMALAMFTQGVFLLSGLIAFTSLWRLRWLVGDGYERKATYAFGLFGIYTITFELAQLPLGISPVVLMYLGLGGMIAGAMSFRGALMPFFDRTSSSLFRGFIAFCFGGIILMGAGMPVAEAAGAGAMGVGTMAVLATLSSFIGAILLNLSGQSILARMRRGEGVVRGPSMMMQPRAGLGLPGPSMILSRSRRDIPTIAFTLLLLLALTQAAGAFGPSDGLIGANDPPRGPTSMDWTSQKMPIALTEGDTEVFELEVTEGTLMVLNLELRWDDEADADRHQNQGDEFEVSVLAPEGSGWSESARNPHGGEGVVSMMIPVEGLDKADRMGFWTISVTLVDAGDQTPIIADPLGMRTIQDVSAEGMLVVEMASM